MLEINNHSSETNFIINKDGSHKVYPRLQLTTEMVNVFFSKTKRDKNFSQKTLRCFPNSTERSKACPSINKTIIFGKGDTKSGRLKHFMPSWKKLIPDLEIIDIVEGYKIPLIEFPSEEGLPRQVYLIKGQEDLAKLEIQEMLQKGAIRPALPIKNQFVSNVFLVGRKDGGHRPVTKKLNKFCLCFGFVPAPRIFNKLLKVPISVLRRLYVRVIIDLDKLLMNESVQDIMIARDSNLPLSISGFLGNLPLSMSEFCDKPGEVSLESGVKYRISGRFGRFKKYDIETDRRKSLKSFNLLRNNFSQSILRIEKNIRLSLLPNTSSTLTSAAVSIFATRAS